MAVRGVIFAYCIGHKFSIRYQANVAAQCCKQPLLALLALAQVRIAVMLEDFGIVQHQKALRVEQMFVNRLMNSMLNSRVADCWSVFLYADNTISRKF